MIRQRGFDLLKFDFVEGYRCRGDDQLLGSLVLGEYKRNYLKSVVLSKEAVNVLKKGMRDREALASMLEEKSQPRYKEVVAVFYDYAFLLSDGRLISAHQAAAQGPRAGQGDLPHARHRRPVGLPEPLLQEGCRMECQSWLSRSL